MRQLISSVDLGLEDASPPELQLASAQAPQVECGSGINGDTLRNKARNHAQIGRRARRSHFLDRGRTVLPKIR
jgi:hypothetical protein